MELYLLKSAACMGIFYIFYKFLLEKENMHVYKRFYLLLAITASLIIPTIVFTEYVLPDPITNNEISQALISDTNFIEEPLTESNILNVELILWSIYFLGFAFFGFLFIRNLFQIVRRIRKNPKQKSNSTIQVLLKEYFPPHTFFNYIFLNKKKLESNEIPEEVLLHEEMHARQKHSLDVIFIEILQVIFWFNPLVYLFKKAIKLNHEFLADQAVLNKEIDQTTYQNTLLSYLSHDSEKEYSLKMANAFNYSSIKKRFTIMKTKTSKKSVLLRSMLLLPLLAILVLGFTQTKLIEKEANSKLASEKQLNEYNKLAKGHNLWSDHNLRPRESEIRKVKQLYSLMSQEQKNNAEIFPAYPKKLDGASKKQIKEYNALAKEYNTMLTKSKGIQIKMKDVNRLKYLYGLMTKKQKAAAEPFPDFPEPPPMPETPDAPEPPKVKYYEEILKEVIENQEIIAVENGNVNIQKTVVNSGFYLGNEDTIVRFEMPKTPKTIKNINQNDGSNGLNYSRRDSSPQPPSPPKSPLDHIIEMAKKGATFKYKGKTISSDEAIALVKDKKNLSISTKSTNNNPPVVKILKSQ